MNYKFLCYCYQNIEAWSDYFPVCFGKSFERFVWVQLMYIILTYRLILLLQKMIIHALQWCMDCIVAALYWILWNVCKWMLINAVIISVVLAVKYIWTQGSPNPTKAKQPKQRENKRK